MRSAIGDHKEPEPAAVFGPLSTRLHRDYPLFSGNLDFNE